MKKMLSIVLLGIVVVSLALTGCDNRSDAEKQMDALKKDANSLLK